MKEIQKVNLGPYQASICSGARFFPKLFIYLYQHEKISSLYQVILEIQQILESQDLTSRTHFCPTQCKNY